MSPVSMLTLLLLIVLLYALAWHDKPAVPHSTHEHSNRLQEDKQKERSRSGPTQNNNSRTNSRMFLRGREWKQIQFTPTITRNPKTIHLCATNPDSRWMPWADSARKKGAL